MPRKIDKFVKCLVRSYDIAKEQIREHKETFTIGNVRDVADAIIATDVDDDEGRDKNVLTRQRLNLTLGDLQEAGFVMFLSSLYHFLYIKPLTDLMSIYYS
jgi:hypothetical protein